jgi:hypothetical protein
MSARTPRITTRSFARPATPRWAVVLMALATGGPLAAVVADDVVIEEEQAKEDADAEAAKAAEQVRATVLESSARHMPLGWQGRRLGIDLDAIRARLLTPDMARKQDAMAAVIKRAEKLLIDEATASGVARDQAEMAFGDLAEALAQRNRIGDDLRPLVQAWSDRELLGAAFGKVAEDAMKLDRQGGWRGGSADSFSFGYGTLEGDYESEEEGWRLNLKDSGPRPLALRMIAAKDDLTVVWEAAGADDGGEEYVRLAQTAAGFRMMHVRDGDVALRLQGESFRDCCRVNADVVRREFVPLLRRIGIGPPAMPDDEGVKAEVLCRLRKAAGVEERKAAEADESLEAGKHRLAQAAAVIDAFGLLDDAAYLAALKPAAEEADARAIEARLAKLATSAAP